MCERGKTKDEEGEEGEGEHKEEVALYPGHMVRGKSGLVSTVCACAKNSMSSWGIVYHRLRTVNLYHTAPKHVRPSQDYPANMAVNSEDFDKVLKFAVCCIGKGDFTLKAVQLDAIKFIYDGKEYFCGSHGSLSTMKSAVCFQLQAQ